MLLSVYANDTNTFINFIEYEYKIAINYTNSKERTSLLRAIKTQLLVVYGVKVEGVPDTPSKIVDLLDIVNSHLNNEN